MKVSEEQRAGGNNQPKMKIMKATIMAIISMDDVVE
jgi:hypothetical protein